MTLENLQQGSFRGIPFLIGNVSTTGGRKQVTHEYPGSDRRQVEDLGLLNDTFTINAVVKTDVDFVNRDRLKQALSQSGSGILVHPFFGTNTVTARPYTISETTRSLGVARFTMVFDRAQPAIFPAKTSVKPALIKAQSDIVIDSINTDVAEIFEVNTNSPSNYTAAKSKLESISDTFGGIGRSVSAISGDISTFTATVSTFTSGIVSNIFAPATLADSITDMFLEFDTLAPDAEAQYNLALQLFGFGEDDSIVETTTVARQQKADNQDILNSSMRTNALALAYNNAASIDYDNELRLQAVRDALEAEYQALLDIANLSGDTINDLTELRNSLRLFFEDIEVTVAKIATIRTNTIPMSILAYQYYGNTDQTQALIDLNNTTDVSFVTGETQILTQ